MRVYFEVCDGYETADIVYVVDQFLSGSVDNWNPNFAPTPPLLSQQLRKLDDNKRKWDNLDHALHAQLEDRRRDEEFNDGKTAESRARVKAIVDAGVAGLKRTEDTTELDARVKGLILKGTEKVRARAARQKQNFTAGDDKEANPE